jgi:hypothetical protein
MPMAIIKAMKLASRRIRGDMIVLHVEANDRQARTD